MKRKNLPMQLELISNILNDEEIVKELSDVSPDMTRQQMNAKVIKVLAIAMRNRPEDMDELAQLHSGKSKEEVEKLSDKQYASLLRTAIMTDVLGFFG